MTQQFAKSPVKSEDTAHASGDAGLFLLAIRNNAGTSLVSASGDYTGLQVNSVGELRVVSAVDSALDSFGNLIVGSVNNQIDIQYYRDTPANLVTVTTANGGTATATGGMATYAATAAASSSAKGVTLTSTSYTAGAEIYAIFTAAFTGSGSGTSYQRIGLFDANNGVFIGYEADTFNVTIRKGAGDVSTPKASWNVDTLTGAATSKFTRNGTPEAIDLTKLNVFRLRFGWVGSAPLQFEVLSPDGVWVLFHVIRQPNNAAVPSLENADLPFTCEVNSGNSGAALTVLTNCWCAGTSAALVRMDSTITDASYAQLTRSVITGETTAGGGSYVNVKVDPSGAIATAGTISSIVPGTAATNLGKAEDAAHSSGATGVMALAVRNDAGTTLADTTGDYAPFSLDANGALRVTGGGGGTEYTEDAAAAADPVGGANILVRMDTPAGITTTDGDNVAQRGTNYGAAFVQILTSGGAFVDSFGGGTQYAVDDALGATPTGTLAVAIRDDALSALTPVEGDAVGLRVDANGALWVIPSGTTVVSATNLDIRDLTSVSDSVSAVQSGTWNIGTVTTITNSVAVTGTFWQATQPVSNAGTFAVQVDGAALTALQLIDDTVFADDAAFTVATSKVQAQGKLAVAMNADPDALDAADAGIPIMNRHRVPFVIGGHPNVLLQNLNVSDADGAQTNAAIITVGAGSKIVVTHITVAVDAATTATGGVAVRIGFGTASTPALDAAGVLLSHSGIPAGGGISLGNGGGILGVGADNEDLRITCEDPAGGNIDITVGYYLLPT